MPYQWGTTGLGLSLDATGEDPEPTWGWIFDADMSRDLGGRISMLDDPREAMAAALSYLGYSINSTDGRELREAADLIARTTERLAAFDSDQYEDLLISGETEVAHGYSGDSFAAFDEAWDSFVHVIPEEGADSYASPNGAAEELIDAEVRDDPAVYPPPDVLERLQFIENTGASETLSTDLFTDAKS